MSDPAVMTEEQGRAVIARIQHLEASLAERDRDINEAVELLAGRTVTAADGLVPATREILARIDSAEHEREVCMTERDALRLIISSARRLDGVPGRGVTGAVVAEAHRVRRDDG